jgi:hypothetical protein
LLTKLNFVHFSARHIQKRCHAETKNPLRGIERAGKTSTVSELRCERCERGPPGLKALPRKAQGFTPVYFREKGCGLKGRQRSLEINDLPRDVIGSLSKHLRVPRLRDAGGGPGKGREKHHVLHLKLGLGRKAITASPT